MSTASSLAAESARHSWPRIALGYLVSEMGGGTPSKDNQAFWSGTIPWVSPKDMKVRVIQDTLDHVSEHAIENSPLKLVAPGSVLFVVRGMILAHTVPVAIAGTPLTVNQDMKALIPGPRLLSNFLAYTLEASQPRLLSLVEEAGHGTRCLRSELWRKFDIGVPAVPMQRAIAGYLDRKTAAIDALIEKKERLITLLAEKRAALINQAVTKGLNPDAPMKDSGVPWIGEIPAHWRVKQLRHLLDRPLRNGLFKKKECFGRGTLLVNVTDAYSEDFIVNDSKLDRVDASPSERRTFKAASGDIFFVRSSLKLEGVARAVCTGPEIEARVFECHLVGARPRRSAISSLFLANYLNAQRVQERLVSLAQTTTMTTISQDKISSLETLVPPRDEQDCIVSKLDAAHSATLSANKTLELQIARLREYRQALITQVVTGQLDVLEEDR